MKDLYSIYEKLDINKVNIKDKGFVKNFPLNGEIEEIAKYLKDYGFKEIPTPSPYTLFDEFKKDIEKENIRIFTRPKNNIVRFANTSLGNEISDDNPIFVINTGNDGTNQFYFESGKWWAMTTFGSEFLAKMMDVFGNK